MSRSYGQYCGLARALDVVGDRWNLLIVRQLLIAPARYRELVEGLPGVATNLLADRLRDLETAGVIERRLAEKGNAVLYALTPWGAELRDRPAPRRSSTVGVAVDDQLFEVRATRSGIEVNPHDGGDLDAVVRADAAIVLGLAAGVLTLDDTLGLIDLEGDEAAVRAIFTPHAPSRRLRAPMTDDPVRGNGLTRSC